MMVAPPFPSSFPCPAPYAWAPLVAADAPPLVVTPPEGVSRAPAALRTWLETHGALLNEQLEAVGALLFRGFEVREATDFEALARALAPDLKKEYLGTSPRVNLTEYVFTASELPPYFPIPQHCEMSFTANPPRRLFFCALRPNDGPGGETPIADARRVYEDLHPEVRERFATRGIRIVRHYDGPSGGGVNPRALKRWDEMFGTTDRAEVERKCVEQGFCLTWLGGERLRLESDHPAFRVHEADGRTAWFNHAQVFHAGAASAEYAHIARRMGWRYRFLGWVAAAVGMGERWGLFPPAMDCLYGDGSPIPQADIDHVRDVFWRHMVFPRWQLGDVLAIDNLAVSHGRMPYTGPRTVAVAWA